MKESVLTALQLDLFVDPTAWEGTFDSIEVWRSRFTEGGPYENLTGPLWTPARIPVGVLVDPPSPPQAGPMVAVSGLTLQLLFNEKTPVTVTFTGTNPITMGSAAAQIQEAAPALLLAFVLDGGLILQTLQAGAAAVLRVVGGNAAPLLGLPIREPGNLAMGVDPRIALIHGTTNYSFTDVNGSGDFFYKTRFFNIAKSVASEYSLPFQGSGVTTVDSSLLVRGVLDLVDVTGTAVANKSVLLFNRFAGDIVDGKTVVGPSSNGLTDANGHIEFLLVRGTKVTIAISGTSLARDITVPTDPTVTSFNLLDPAYGKDDLFTVQVPALNYAVRRSF